MPDKPKSKSDMSQVKDQILNLLQNDHDLISKIVESVTSCIIDKILKNEETLKTISTTIFESEEFKSMAEKSRQEIFDGVTFDMTKSESIETHNIALKENIKKLKEEIDNLEQYSRRNCILIHGVKESNKEVTDDLAREIFNTKLHLDVNVQDLDRSHRIGRKTPGKTRPIIVKFATYNRRREVFSTKKNLKGSKITITESLTSNRLELLHLCKGDENVETVWSSDGRIICLLKDGSTAVVEKHDDLAKLSHPQPRARRTTRQQSGKTT